MENKYFNFLKDLYASKKETPTFTNLTQILKDYQLNKALSSVLIKDLQWISKHKNEYVFTLQKPKVADAKILESTLKTHLKNVRVKTMQNKKIVPAFDELPVNDSYLTDEAIKNVLDEVATLTVEIDKLQADLNKERKESTEILIKNAELTRKIAQLQGNIEDGSLEYKHLKSINILLGDQNDSLIKEVEDLKATYTDTVKSNAYVRSLLEDKQNELQNTNQVFDNCKNMLMKEQHTVEQLNEKLKLVNNKWYVKFPTWINHLFVPKS